ncbi:hypothetical protein BC831DRAFT_457458 [Entophlyctis helioformis]|nr:hypothetical protein BC831DRAFT_457458 [Entophlyctis helioformis]
MPEPTDTAAHATDADRPADIGTGTGTGRTLRTRKSTSAASQRPEVLNALFFDDMHSDDDHDGRSRVGSGKPAGRRTANDYNSDYNSDYDSRRPSTSVPAKRRSAATHEKTDLVVAVGPLHPSVARHGVAGGHLPLSPYELERQRNIARNQEMLRMLGLATGGDSRSATSATAAAAAGSAKRKRQSEPHAASKGQTKEPTRRSARRQSQGPLSEAVSDAHDTKAVRKRAAASATAAALIPSDGASFGNVPWSVSAPFTIWSNRVTITRLGSLVTDPSSAALYWCHPGCMFRHPYPVGFESTKWHFDRQWTMCISSSETGPVFTVTSDNGRVFSGSSPTRPWTDVCNAMSKKHGRTRVSGPLFFGFSDPMTMVAIEQMPGFAQIGGELGAYLRPKTREPRQPKAAKAVMAKPATSASSKKSAKTQGRKKSRQWSGTDSDESSLSGVCSDSDKENLARD